MFDYKNKKSCCYKVVYDAPLRMQANWVSVCILSLCACNGPGRKQPNHSRQSGKKKKKSESIPEVHSTRKSKCMSLWWWLWSYLLRQFPVKMRQCGLQWWATISRLLGGVFDILDVFADVRSTAASTDTSSSGGYISQGLTCNASLQTS